MTTPDPLHAMQFRPAPPSQVRSVRPAHRPPQSDRECPLDTAGDRCLWHVGGTASESNNACTRHRQLQLGPRVRPVLADYCLVGKSPEGSRQLGGETRTPLHPSPPYEVRGLWAERAAGLPNVR
jgi:hypothetical protein